MPLKPVYSLAPLDEEAWAFFWAARYATGSFRGELGQFPTSPSPKFLMSFSQPAKQDKPMVARSFPFLAAMDSKVSDGDICQISEVPKRMLGVEEFRPQWVFQTTGLLPSCGLKGVKRKHLSDLRAGSEKFDEARQNASRGL